MAEKFTFFFGPENPFSQWHVLGDFRTRKTQFRAKCQFSGSTHNFVNCEQWMMFNKAKLFRDDAIAEKILSEIDSKTIKALGRKVKNFNESTWNHHRVGIIYEGNKHKFTQNLVLLEKLLATQSTTLVEASPFDKIWGIGLRATDPRASSREKWKGLNLLGEALTRLRDDLMAEYFPPSVPLAVTESSNFRQSQFQGSILGVLVGDAIGLPFELQADVVADDVQKYFDELNKSRDVKPKFYSDDTAMTISVAQSIVACKGLTVIDMAKRFTNEFFKDNRHYGGTVGNVFLKLREMKFSDPFLPAKIQQNGKGSWGNGAAMRVAPIPLLFMSEVKNPTEMLDIVVDSSRITHTHPLGIAGAVFQALVIKHALTFGESVNNVQADVNCQQNIPNQILCAVEADWGAIKEGKFIGADAATYVQDGLNEYSKKLNTIHQLLQNVNQKDITREVVSKLGNKISAIDSVTTAFYCFLISFQNLPQVKTDNQFQRSIQLAISLGGDTDTIASMTGAICGAYLGSQQIPITLLRHCFGVANLSDLAQQIYDNNAKQVKIFQPSEGN